MRGRWYLLMRSPDDKGGSGGGGGGSGSTETESRTEANRRAEGGKDIADRLVTRYGSEREALRVLSEENYEYRDNARKLRTENDDLKKKLPKEGEFVLTKEQKAEWDVFSGLKMPAATVKEKVEGHAKLEEQVTKSNREKEFKRAAETLGYNPKVLAKVLAAEGLHMEMKEIEVEEDGKEVTKKVPHVRPASDEKAELKPLDTYVKKNLPEFLPALQATENGTERSKKGEGSSASGTDTGVTFPQQTGSKGKAPATTGEVLSTYLGSQDYAIPGLDDKKK